MRRGLAVCMAVAVLPGVAHGAALEYAAPRELAPDAVLIDTRPAPACSERSLPGARCLPAADLVGPQGALPSFADLLWAFGTAGLSGHETVAVFGDRARERDYVAGLLYLAGQARVRIVDAPLRRMLGDGAGAPGRPRGVLRDPIYTATMRDEAIVLRSEARAGLARGQLRAVDGRPAEVFARGHLPGAVNLPYVPGESRAEPAVGSTPWLAYGQGPMDSIALFARLRAATGAEVRVLLSGWRGWVAGAPAAPGTTLHDAPKPASAAATARGAAALAAVFGLLFLTTMILKRKGDRWT